MKPHKHAKLIKAWADGSEIEIRTQYPDKSWSNWEVFEEPRWGISYAEYRIKPELKPNYLTFLTFNENGWSEAPISCYVRSSKRALKLIHDDETGELKSAEVIK